MRCSRKKASDALPAGMCLTAGVRRQSSSRIESWRTESGDDVGGKAHQVGERILDVPSTRSSRDARRPPARYHGPGDARVATTTRG